MGLWLWLGLMVSGAAHAAAQKDFSVDKGEVTWDYGFTWRDDVGRHNVQFSLPAAEMEADKAERTWLPRAELNKHIAKEVRVYGKTLPDVKVKAYVDGAGVRVEASGPKGEAKAALKQAESVQESATDAWLADNGFTRTDGGLTFDHARLVAEYAPALTPVADALKADSSGPRDYVERALTFVQSIPYEARKKRGGDPGYRRPLILLARNRGDCDSKSVLFLGLVRAAYPELPLAVIYVPGHALTGVGLEPTSADRTFKVDGTQFVYAEPVGPALHPLGDTDGANRKAGKKGEVRVVPR